MSESKPEPERAAENEPTKPVRRRRGSGKKRLVFRTPRNFPRGVRELWETASPPEQERAHQVCTQILSMWLGKTRRQDVAAELSIAPLRVWQLSQQALAGMLAGLLHQPKARKAREEEKAMMAKDDDPRVLKKRLAEREKTILEQQELIRLLSSIPKPRSEPPSSSPSTTAAKMRVHKRAARADGEGGASAGTPAPAPR